MEGGKEQNYWPGFVDALSNVVLTLVFVLVVFVFALVISSNKVERRAAELVQAAHEESNKKQSNTNMNEVMNQLQRAEEEISQLKQQNEILTSLQNTTQIDASGENGLKVVGRTTISKSQGKIIIVFPQAVSDLDQASLDDLKKAFTDENVNFANAKIMLRSYIGKESYSAARRLAYYRILGIRNVLTNEYTVTKERITSQILTPTEHVDGRLEIIFD